jgi:serine protease inhibitor
MRALALIVVSALLLITGTSKSALTDPVSTDRVLLAQSRLGASLLQRLAETPRDNVVISPASLAAVLALLDLGADPSMHEALQRILGFERMESPRASRSEQTMDELGVVRAATLGLAAGIDDPSGKFAMANMIVIDPKTDPNRGTMIDMGENGGAEVITGDVTNPAAIQSLNAWIASKTGGLIPSLLDEPPADPGLIAVNALYFKGLWSQPFDKKATALQAFTNAIGTKTNVAMMQGERRLPFRAEGRFVAVDIPYKNPRFSLVVVTTQDRPAQAKEFA